MINPAEKSPDLGKSSLGRTPQITQSRSEYLGAGFSAPRTCPADQSSRSEAQFLKKSHDWLTSLFQQLVSASRSPEQELISQLYFFYGHENDLSAFQAHSQEATRFPCTHGEQSWSRHHQEPSQEGPQAPHSKGCRDSLQAPHRSEQHKVIGCRLRAISLL
jgi:hypothetical protein